VESNFLLFGQEYLKITLKTFFLNLIYKLRTLINKKRFDINIYSYNISTFQGYIFYLKKLLAVEYSVKKFLKNFTLHK